MIIVNVSRKFNEQNHEKWNLETPEISSLKFNIKREKLAMCLVFGEKNEKNEHFLHSTWHPHYNSYLYEHHVIWELWIDALQV